MIQPDPPARMPQLASEAFTDDTRAFLERWDRGNFRNGSDNPVLRTFAHNPTLAGLFSELNLHLLQASSVPVKIRQIAIMRVAWITGTKYMWSSHLNTSRLFGLTDEMYHPIQVGASDPYFSEIERWVIRATDELVEHHKVGEASWDALIMEWSHQQMLDFLFTVGCYVAIAGVMQSTGVGRDADLLELAEQYGEP